MQINDLVKTENEMGQPVVGIIIGRWQKGIWMIQYWDHDEQIDKNLLVPEHMLNYYHLEDGPNPDPHPKALEVLENARKEMENDN